MSAELARVEVQCAEGISDPGAAAILTAAHAAGLGGVESVGLSRVYVFRGEAGSGVVEELADRLLTNPVTEQYRVGPAEPSAGIALSMSYRPGTQEPILHSLREILADLSIADSLEPLGTARRVSFFGSVEAEELESFARRWLYNPLVERLGEPGELSTGDEPSSKPRPKTIHLAGLSIEALLRLSSELGLALDQTEMLALQSYYAELGREATLMELESVAQTWSEHCVHKTFKARIQHGELCIDNLFKSTIVKATDSLDRPDCVSVFVDNAGIIRFDEEVDLCFKAETHNHPSAIDPYGGSATGLGGVIRDILGAGKGALPIAGMDVFCVGPQDLDPERLPKGSHHPRRILSGIVAGIRDYGNRIGIPTVAGGVYVDEGYVANPVVFAGCLGVMPRNQHQKEVAPGDLVVLLGNLTGFDGIHGVTFSSLSLTDASEEDDRSAVQIGDPIVEQILIEPLLKARDEGLFRSITDCGGGGLSSAVGEMGEVTGVEVDLERVPLKVASILPTEIWISESQERMVLAVPPEHLARVEELFSAEDVLCTVIGRFRGDRRLVVRHQGEIHADLPMSFLHDGLPRRELVSTPPKPNRTDHPRPEKVPELGDALLRCLRHDNVRSKEAVIRQYDHEVQGRTLGGPFAGVNQGPSDAAVMLPRLAGERGAVLSLGFNPLHGKLDAYRMAANAIDEAVRNAICVGGDPELLVLLDNFIWGDVRDQDELGKLVEACIACHDVALGFKAPFVSGKDSLNNTYTTRDGERRSITPTLIISALTQLPCAAKSLSMDLKQAGNRLYLVGRAAPELGGSIYFATQGIEGGVVPEVRAEEHFERAKRLHCLMLDELIVACHDLGEGGVLTALAEMALASDLGLRVALDDLLPEERTDIAVFAEPAGCYIVEIAPESEERLLAAFPDGEALFLGSVEAADASPLFAATRGGESLVNLPVAALREAWSGEPIL